MVKVSNPQQLTHTLILVKYPPRNNHLRKAGFCIGDFTLFLWRSQQNLDTLDIFFEGCWWTVTLRFHFSKGPNRKFRGLDPSHLWVGGGGRVVNYNWNILRPAVWNLLNRIYRVHIYSCVQQKFANTDHILPSVRHVVQIDQILKSSL